MSPTSTRETHLYELALEHVFGRPYPALVEEARQTGQCSDLDLLQLGRRLLIDLARLARGEIASIHVPDRLPRTGEHAAAMA